MATVLGARAERAFIAISAKLFRFDELLVFGLARVSEHLILPDVFGGGRV